MNRSTPGLPVHHQLPEFTQIHAHRVSDAIQPSHPLLSPFPPTSTFPSIWVFSFGQSKQQKQAQSQCVKSLHQGMGTITIQAESYIEGLSAVPSNGLKET